MTQRRTDRVQALILVWCTTWATPSLAPATPPEGPDITICQLHSLGSRGRTGTYPVGTNGLSLAVTPWNIGNERVMWQESPDADHPFLTMDLYRLDTFQISGTTIDRLEHIGQSWCFHEFFALSNLNCGPHPFTGEVCLPTDGQTLGIGCTTTHSAGLTGTQSALGPRFEINPWTSEWTYSNSMFLLGGPSNTPIRRRLQVLDQDLITPADHSYQLFAQTYYVSKDDTDAMDSAGWKPIANYSWSGTMWTFAMSSATTDEVSGFAIDAWTGARQTLIAQQFPIIEQWTADQDGPGGLQASPDGRAIIAAKVFDLGDGNWRYEYAVLNVDMNRQIGSFTIPAPSDVAVSELGSSAVLHHDEPLNAIGGKDIDNDPWIAERNTDSVTWSTDPYEPTATSSNPIRWGTMYNFWFTATTPPGDGLASVGMFKPGTPASLAGLTDSPTAPPPPILCLGDADSDDDRDFADITATLAAFGTDYLPDASGFGDSDHNGIVDFGDVTSTLAAFGAACP